MGLSVPAGKLQQGGGRVQVTLQFSTTDKLFKQPYLRLVACAYIACAAAGILAVVIPMPAVNGRASSPLQQRRLPKLEPLFLSKQFSNTPVLESCYEQTCGTSILT